MAKDKDWIDEQYGPNAEDFRARYVADLERELEGAETRGDKEYAKNVKVELAQFQKKATPAKETAEKRPTAGAKETR